MKQLYDLSEDFEAADKSFKDGYAGGNHTE